MTVLLLCLLYSLQNGIEGISLLEALRQSARPFPAKVGEQATGGDQEKEAAEAGKILDAASGKGWHWIAGGRVAALFPEAGRTNASTVLEFAPGAEALARCIASRRGGAASGTKEATAPRTHLLALNLPKVLPGSLGRSSRGGAGTRSARRTLTPIANRPAHDPEGVWIGLACRLATYYPTGGYHA